MNDIQRVPASNEDEIDIITLWWLVWDYKILVGAITLICALIALVLALTATPLFRAVVVVTEVRDSGLGGESGLAGEFGGLASLAGLDLKGDRPERLATLRSRQLVEAFVKRPDVLPVLRARANPDATLWTIVERFRSTALDIQEDKLKGTMTVTIDWVDPAVAARWGDEFVALANEQLRNKAVEDASRNVAYLKEQVEHTSSVEIQKVLYSLIEQQTKTLMLAKGRVEYAFSVVDPAVKAEMRISPRRKLMVLSGVAVGLFLGSYISWVRSRFARSKRRFSAGTSV